MRFSAPLFALALPLQAASVAIVNPGFEDISGESPFNEFTFGPLNGWALHDPGNVTGGGVGGTYYIGTLRPTAPTFFTAGAPAGERVGIAFNYSGSGNGGEYGLQQTLSDTLAANTRYTLRVDIGNIASGTAQNNAFFNLSGFPGYRIDFQVNNITVASDNNTLAALIPEGEFRTGTVTYTTPAVVDPGQTIRIRLVNLNMIDPSAPNADLEVDFDNVRLDALAIPEPSITVLTAIALWMTPFRRNRRPGAMASTRIR